MRITQFVSGILLGSAMAFAPFAQAGETATAPKTIRWVLAHEPIDLFKKAADSFAAEINAKAGGKLKVEVLTLPEYAAKYNNGVTPKASEVVGLVQSGQIEMSQMYTTTLGELNKNMYVLDMPYLFRDHAHAANVLEGKIGQTLLADLGKKKVQGLAFTYSGGYRVIPAKTAIRKVEDFKGMKIRTSNSPVAQDTFAALGAKAVPLDLAEVGPATRKGEISAAESTYPRFYSLRQNEYSKVLNDTQHSLFLTSIITSSAFWSSLDADTKKIVSEAAVNAARLERKESISDAETTKEKCRKEGIEVVALPEAEQAKFKAAMGGVYKKYEGYFPKGLIGQIQQAK